MADRQKWRIRIYNYSDSRILLERKKKWGSYIHKDSAILTREEYEKLMAGEYEFLLGHPDPLCREFYYECMVNLWRPKVIVDYEREPLIQDEERCGSPLTAMCAPPFWILIFLTRSCPRCLC